MTSAIAPHLANSLFLRRLVCYLMPYFAAITTNMDRAEADIVETLASYGARTRSEILNVVQVIAYSMSGLELLMLAKVDTTLSPSQQIRLRGCANSLNRSAHQAEKTLTARLKCDPPPKPATLTQPTLKTVPAAPTNDTTPAQTEDILRRVDDHVAAVRNAARVAAARNAAAHPASREKAGAMFDAVFAEMFLPPQPAAPQPPAENNPIP